MYHNQALNVKRGPESPGLERLCRCAREAEAQAEACGYLPATHTLRGNDDPARCLPTATYWLRSPRKPRRMFAKRRPLKVLEGAG